MHYLVARGARRALPFVLLAAAACGSPAKSSTPPAPVPTPAPPPPTGSGDTVVGTERIGWDQALLAGSAQDEYTFSWFVDDLRAGAAAATCSAPSAATLSCSAPLPKLTPGPHRLRVTAIRTLASGRFESPQSDALTVVQLGSSFPALTPAVTAAAREITDRAPAEPREDPDRPAGERISVVARGLNPVADVAAAGDLVLVAERQGTVRLVRDGSMLSDAALVLDDVVANAPGLGLLAVAAHPAFADNHLVYWIYTAATPTGPVYRLARGREAAGHIAETAVLLDGVEASPSGWAALRFGPDGKLYAAFAAASDAVRPGSYAGHVLRLDDTGRTPRDNPGATPVLGETGGTPLALVWSDAGELGIVRALADGRRDFRTSLAQPGATQTWPANERPAGAAYYRAELLPDLAGRLLVGMMDGGIGLAGAPGEPGGVTRRIAAAYGAARALAVSASGEIYLGTANGDLPGEAGLRRRGDFLLCVKGARR